MNIGQKIIPLISRMGDAVFADGVDSIPYLIRIEDEFAIQIPDKDAEQIKTLDELCQYIAITRQQSGRAMDDKLIWETVRAITADEFGVDENELHLGIRYVEDLGC